MTNEKEEHYKYLFYKAVENENLDLLKSIPKEYTPFISMKFADLDIYCKTNNFFNIKYAKLMSKDKFLLSICFIYSSKYKNLNLMNYLLKNGADIHARNDLALRNASEKGDLEIIKYLVKCGSNIHIQQEYALRWASCNGYLDVVKYLIKNGADIHISQDTPLKWAKDRGHKDIIEYLESLYK